MILGSSKDLLVFFANFAAMSIPVQRSNFRFYAVWLLMGLASSTLWGCQGDAVCEEAAATSLRMGFYTLTTEGIAVSTTIDSLTVFGLNRPEDKIYDNQKNAARIELPLNPSLDATAFVFLFPEHTDTIWFDYSRIPHLISAECGFTLFFDIESIAFTNHYIITGEIDIKLVSNTLDEHIKLIISDTANGL